MKIYFTKKFVQQYRHLVKYNPKLAKKVNKRIEIFTENPRYPILKTHKLSGRLSDKWVFWVSWDLRIVFEFLNKDKVRFLLLGKHDQVYR